MLFTSSIPPWHIFMVLWHVPLSPPLFTGALHLRLVGYTLARDSSCAVQFELTLSTPPAHFAGGLARDYRNLWGGRHFITKFLKETLFFFSFAVLFTFVFCLVLLTRHAIALFALSQHFASFWTIIRRDKTNLMLSTGSRKTKC